MRKALDVNNINPFLQSTMSVFESVTQMKLAVGKPAMADFAFTEPTYSITVGVVGQMKGQAVLALRKNRSISSSSRSMVQ